MLTAIRENESYTLTVERDVVFNGGPHHSEIRIRKELLTYFQTLANMIEYSLDSTMSIKVPLKETVMQWCIAMATIHHNNVMATGSIFKTKSMMTFDEFFQYVSLKGLDNEKDIASLLLALDYLEVPHYMIVLVTDKLYQVVRALKPVKIRTMMTNRDKTEKKKKKKQVGLNLSPQYLFERLVRDYVSELLPEGLVLAMHAVEKYVNPIQCGEKFLVLMRANGSLVCFGDDKITRAVRSREFKDTRVISSTSRTCFCLTEAGKLYGCGDDSAFMFIKEAYSNDFYAKWTKIQLPKKMDDDALLDVIPKVGYTLCFSSKGIYFNGKSESIEFGFAWIDQDERGVSPIQWVPLSLSTKERIVRVACSANQIAFLTPDHLYITYNNDSIELFPHYADSPKFSIVDSAEYESQFNGEGYMIPSVVRITEVRAADIASFAVGKGTLFIVTHKGEVYVSGGVVRSLGLDITEEMVEWVDKKGVSLTRLDLATETYGKPLAVYTHEENDCVVLRTSMGLFAAGTNWYGELAVYDQLRRAVFTRMLGMDADDNDVRSVTCGPRSVYVLTTKSLYVSGDIEIVRNYISRENKETLNVLRRYPGTSMLCMALIKLKGAEFDLGYTWSVPDTVIHEESDRATKKRKCDGCLGKALFKSPLDDTLLYCSHYCYYKANIPGLFSY